MRMKTRYFFTLSLSLVPPFAATLACADHGQSIEEVTVQAFPLLNEISSFPHNNPSPSPDSAELLRRIPGANSNGNGVITGIAQYRGLYGERVSVKLDQAPTLTGGPNAMDSPLSYAPSGLLRELVVYRGITPVSLAQESIGGHMVAHFNRGDFGSGQPFQSSGFVTAQLTDNGEQANADLQLVTANIEQKFSLLASHNKGDNFDGGENKTVAGSQYQRDRFDLAYGWQSAATELTLYLGRQDIADTGTPALAMDIVYVETDLAGLTLTNNSGNRRFNMAISWADVAHGMDNFSLRQTPASNMAYRRNTATADNLSWAVNIELPWSFAQTNAVGLKLGTDGNLVNHHSLISNPENALFQLVNFNHSSRDSFGLFAELSGDIDDWSYQLGIRQNRIELHSNRVAASGMTGMMASAANILATQFNQADHSLNHNTHDLVLKFNRAVAADTSVTIDLGIKQRAPSYQESFLWLPLSATGGLADGRNYIGNLSLKPESSREITLGLSKTGDRFAVYPQIFYRDIHNYIQGVANAGNNTANTLSIMMSGAPALVYSNTDARIYGIDANWYYSINHWSADGVVSYVRGKRTDIADNLYRLAPANARFSLRYQVEQSPLQLTVESVVYARQKHVARYNREVESAGFAIVNLGANWSLNQGLQVRAGIKNLFDRLYANHLNGINRIAGSDIAPGERIPATGRAFYLSIELNF